MGLVILLFTLYHFFLLIKDIDRATNNENDCEVETKIGSHLLNTLVGTFFLIFSISFLNFGPSDPKPSSLVERQQSESKKSPGAGK
jgi:hypothetical protein